MNYDVPKGFVRVAPSVFRAVVEAGRDYRRDGWSDGVVYRDVWTGRDFGFIADEGGRVTEWCAAHWLHPDLVPAQSGTGGTIGGVNRAAFTFGRNRR